MANPYSFNYYTLAYGWRAFRFGSVALALGLAGATATFATDKQDEKAKDQTLSAPADLPHLPTAWQELIFSYLDGRAQRNLLPTGKAIRPAMLERFRRATSLEVRRQDPRGMTRILQDYAGNTRLKKISFQAGFRIAAADLHELARRFPALEELVFNPGSRGYRTSLDAAALTAIASFTQLKTLGLPRLWVANHGGFAQVSLAPLAALQQLDDLDLTGNNTLDDEHLGFLNQLTGLKRLSLSGTRCSGTFLEELAPETNLETLNLQGCLLRPGVLSGLAAHPNLTFLGLGNTPVEDGDLPFIGALVQLRHLDLSGDRNLATPKGIQQLGSLRDLRRLDLNHNSTLGTPGLAAVAAALPGLEELNLARMGKLAGEGGGIGPLVHLARLRKLDLANTRLPAGSLAPLAGLEHLEYLDLTKTRLGAADIAVIQGKHALTTLILDETAITDAHLEQFSALQSLKVLSLRRVRISDHRGVAALVRFQGLTHLNLSNLQYFTWDERGEIPSWPLPAVGQPDLEALLALPHLGYLDLRGTAISEASKERFKKAFAAQHQGRHLQVRHP